MERQEAIHKSRKQIFINNFIGGIAWGLGATVGLAIIITLLGFVLKNINLVPFIGNFVADVIKFVISKQPTLVR